MKFEWSETKRQIVPAERGLDFIDAADFFEGRPLVTAPSPRGEEERWLSIGGLARSNGIATTIGGPGTWYRGKCDGPALPRYAPPRRVPWVQAR